LVDHHVPDVISNKALGRYKRKWNLAILVQFIQLHVKENKIRIKILACTCVCPATYQGYADNLERIIFRLHCSDNSEKKIFRLLRLQHRRLHLRQQRLATLEGSTSRTSANYRQHLGARHHLAPECKNSRSRSAISSTSTTQRSQQRSGAR
jgi:hypothetical protein